MFIRMRSIHLSAARALIAFTSYMSAFLNDYSRSAAVFPIESRSSVLISTDSARAFACGSAARNPHPTGTGPDTGGPIPTDQWRSWELCSRTRARAGPRSRNRVTRTIYALLTVGLEQRGASESSCECTGWSRSSAGAFDQYRTQGSPS